MVSGRLSHTSRFVTCFALTLIAVIGISVQARAATIFEDDFSVNPADNGWTEAVSSTLGDDANIDINGSGQVLFHKPSGSGHVSRSIIRTFNTVGFENIEFVMTAFQGAGAGGDPGAAGNTFETTDYFRLKFSFVAGSGDDDFSFYERQVWNGIDDTVGDGGGNLPPNTVSTATASIPLPAAAANNPGLDLKIIARVNVAGEDYYADNFILTGTPIAVPEPASILLFASMAAMTIGFWYRRK